MEVKKETYQVTATSLVISKLRGFGALVKFRLSFLVVFSALVGYMLAPGVVGFDWVTIGLLSLGGFLVTGASNAFNQILEVDSDKLMNRTSGRPLPKQVLSSSEAVTFAIFTGIGGIFLLWYSFNMTAALLGIIALLSYAFVYTPMKKKSPISVFIGAFPGAMPVLIGYAAAAGDIGTIAWTVFLIQFLWQFPHFWAIAWILHEDYSKAGFKMLPSGSGKSHFTATIILIYTATLVPIAVIPWIFGAASVLTMISIALAGLMMTWYAFRLFRTKEKGAAKKLMYASFIYLPWVQIAMLVDKF